MLIRLITQEEQQELQALCGRCLFHTLTKAIKASSISLVIAGTLSQKAMFNNIKLRDVELRSIIRLRLRIVPTHHRQVGMHNGKFLHTMDCRHWSLPAVICTIAKA